MKVILKSDVKNVGAAGDIVTVSPGYARNFLIPRGLAEEATSTKLNEARQAKEKKELRNRQERARAEELKKQIDGIRLVTQMRSGEGGRLFGSVTTQEIAAMLAERDLKVDRRRIEPSDPIKSLGEYKFQIKLHPEVTAQFTVEVKAEDA